MFDSILQPLFRDAKSLTPFNLGQSYPVCSEQRITSCVPCLFFPSSPSAVSGLVVPVIVWIAVKGVTGSWTRPHVFQESLKGIEPPPADLYAPASIVPIVLSLRVVTSRLHQFPSPVFGRAIAYTTSPVLSAGRNHMLILLAPLSRRHTGIGFSDPHAQRQSTHQRKRYRTRLSFQRFYFRSSSRSMIFCSIQLGLPLPISTTRDGNSDTIR